MSELKLSLALTSSPSSPRIPITITTETNAKEMFDIVVKESKIPATALKLIFRGKIISPKEDDKEAVAAKFKIDDGSVVHCMGKPVMEDDTAAPVAAVAAGSTPSPSVPSLIPAAAASAAPPTRTLMQDLHKLQHEGCHNVSSTYLTAMKTLLKIMDNISQNPLEEKYRSIKCSNAAFQKRLGGLVGCEAVLIKCGFEKTPEVYKLEPSAEKWELLQAARGIVQAEITRMSALQAPPAAPAMGAGLGSAEMNALAGALGGGAGGMPPMPPGMDMNMNMMQNMLRDPNALSSMLSDPMVQQALESDPRFAGNPQLRQGLQALQRNPGMVEQMTRMMSDPAMRQRMESMRGMMNQPGAPAPPQPPQQQQQPAVDMQAMQQAMAGIARMAQQQQGGGGGAPPAAGGSNNDEEMTEEEMIAQAIERSLREQ